jgi:hypothetical protein
MLKTRTVTITSPWNKFGQENLDKTIGTHFTVVFWHEDRTDLDTVSVTELSGFTVRPENQLHRGTKATIVKVPVADVTRARTAEVKIALQFKDSLVPGD